MRRTTIGTAAAAAGVAAVVAWRAARERPQRRVKGDRWHSVTINRRPEELGSMPPPLDRLDMPIEVRIRPAPGDRGSEVAARIVGGEPTGAAALTGKVRGDDPAARLRRALREARSRAEVGEVLLPDWPPATHPTVTSAPLAYATRQGREEGRP